MKMKGAPSILLSLVMISLGAAALSAQATLVGTWVNQTTKIYYKYVYTSDGKVQGYSTDGQENPGREACYTIEKQVANADGSTVFYLKERWDYIPYHEEAAVAWYVLWKVSEDGKIAEHTASQKDYMPFDRYPLGVDFHCIYALK